ncbi:iron-containing alcohol dehydrogenase [Succinivibrio sp.]|uniref:iron-containing alcohol dehydrogenase n=1 Tax=Succinivibrio sp. TaxID=2053619 RepID=UPI0025F9AE31|nr:iron-containing alcohol dehydrogenase [Succinivibrio sp.]MBQ9221112.1 iron-containing alcohol dehydrogenase [Succinivibrio sp.]
MKFRFQNTTKVYFGDETLENLAPELLNFGKKVLLVYGGGSIKKNGLYDKITSNLKNGGIEFFELSGVEPNPRHTTVNKGVKICRENNINAILAVGGGSTIDCSKGISATVFSKTDNVWDLVEGKYPIEKTLPIVTILTLSATGSEMDTGAVLSNMDLNIKSGLMHENIRPKVSFEDPKITYSVSKYQTASGSVDIMSHIFDVAYLSKQKQMDMLVNIQEEVLKTVIKYTPIALDNPSDYDARANLMWASSWALNDFMYCGVMQCPILHAIEHELSAFYDITHGHGLAILTPNYLRYIVNDETAPVIYRLGVNCLNVKLGLEAKEGAKLTADALAKLYFETFGLPSKLSDLGIDDSKFEVMAHNCCNGLFGQGKLSALATLEEKDVVEILKMSL